MASSILSANSMKSYSLPKKSTESGSERSMTNPMMAEPWQPESATLHILKKLTSGIPRLAEILGDIVKDFCLDDDYYGIGALLKHETDISFTMGFVSEILFTYIQSALEMLLPIGEFGADFPYESPFQAAVSGDHDSMQEENDSYASAAPTPPKASSPITVNNTPFQIPDIDLPENNQRLDYIITQMDISRMARTASRHLDVESINNLPTIIYYPHDTLICPAYKDLDEDENTPEDAPLIEESDNETLAAGLYQGHHNQESKGDLAQIWSWMVVPSDPEDDVTRVSNSYLKGSVPETISVCQSNHSPIVHNVIDTEKNARSLDAFEHCVICKESFQDGECLRVLPCQHLFHCGCIEKLLSQDQSHGKYYIRGCPTCIEQQDLFSLDDEDQEQVDETYRFDGSVPSWAFSRIGDLLASVNAENTPP